MPERFKDMKVHPEPDDLPAPSGQAPRLEPQRPVSQASSNSMVTRPSDLRPQSQQLSVDSPAVRLEPRPDGPSLRLDRPGSKQSGGQPDRPTSQSSQATPFLRPGSQPSNQPDLQRKKTTERLTPKARIKLVELEAIDSDSPSELSGSWGKGMSAYRIHPVGTDSSYPVLHEEGRTSGILTQHIRPSAELTHAGPRKAMHAGQRSGLLPTMPTGVLPPWFVARIETFVDGRFMLIASVCVTIYALVGDDLRLLLTNRPADTWFNVIALLALIFFSVEIVLSSIGKPDYFLSFFFALDLVATCSLVLDLTWVSEALMPEEDVDMGGNARSGRTARLGATVGRVVRVLRLMRIVKLYRAYFEKMTRKVKRASKRASLALVPGDLEQDDWDNDEEWEEAEKAADESHKESAVGKKLVSLTTRRVIMMVLVMLMVLPYLRVDMSDVFSVSAAWGADSVWQAFVKLDQNSSSTTKRSMYEARLLRFLYYHNWFNRKSCPASQSCPEDFWMHAYWVGFAGRNLDTLRQKVALAQIRPGPLSAWNNAAGLQDLLYFMGSMPDQAVNPLSQTWETRCIYGGMEHLGVSLLRTGIDGVIDHRVECPGDLRPAESQRIHPQLITKEQFEDWHLVFFFDKRPFTREESYLALLATGVICIVLCISTLFFSKDANKLVLKPVERMVEKVKTIANDPLIALRMADAEFELEEYFKYKSTKIRSGRMVKLIERWNQVVQIFAPKRHEQTMETVVLEKTIIKLGSLLALGFGEAGANIVSTNMRGLHSSGVNAMITGNRVNAIMGYAKICDFGFATEVLQGRVMKFVNQIAEVVHGIVNESHGAANKNTGDLFFVVWRTAGLEESHRRRMADLSIISFARILGAVHQSPELAEYRGHPGLQQRLGARFRVNLSFGLHYGWAIEGAVGSEFKIDASYLSPNVSITESLEQATRIYGVSMITSESVINICSPKLAQKARLIDRVIIKGSVTPLELYAIDLDCTPLQVVHRTVEIPWNTRQRFRARQLLEMVKKERVSEDVDVVEQLFECPQVALMRSRYTEEFLQLFKMGFHNYEEGEWQVARSFLCRTYEMVGIRDGPSDYLLKYMGAGHDYEAPAKWKGVHPLEPPR